MKENEVIKRIQELSLRAQNRFPVTFSEFLNLEEQSLLHKADLCTPCLLYGGYDSAERRVAAFGENLQASDFPIKIICVGPVQQKFADRLTHRDFLGSLMGLGVRREMIGDIVLHENKGYIFCLEPIADFITDELRQVRRTTVCCSTAVSLPACYSELPPIQELIVSSARLDVLIAAVFHLSRNESARLFAQSKVFVNSKLTANISAVPKEGDIISVRGFGRFIFEKTARETRKSRLAVCVRVFK